MKSNNQTQYISKSVMTSQRGSRTVLPSFSQTQTQEIKNKLQDSVNRRCIFDHNAAELHNNQRNQNSFEKQYNSLDLKNSSRGSSQMSQTRPRSVTYSESNRQNYSAIQKPNCGLIVIFRKQQEKQQSSGSHKNEGHSSTFTNSNTSLINFIHKDEEIKHLVEKRENGWDQYRYKLTKEVHRCGSSYGDRTSHLTSTPLVNYTNFTARKRQIEQNLNCKDYGLHVQNYSMLDKKTKSFFYNQCKEETQEFQHDAAKQEERNLNNNLIHKSIQNARTKYQNKYCIYQHLNQNRIPKTQLIF